jgi:hypothetical protein
VALASVAFAGGIEQVFTPDNVVIWIWIGSPVIFFVRWVLTFRDRQ